MPALRALVFFLFILSCLPTGTALSLNETIRQAPFSNPLAGVPFYVDSQFSQNILSTIRSAKKREKRKLRPIVNTPTAVWLTTKSSVRRSNSFNTPKIVLKDANNNPRKPLVTFIVYNLPNRDCSAHAAVGKICCKYNADNTCNYYDKSNKCENGLQEYKSQFVDEIARTVRRFCTKVPMAFIIEPDSLPNLVTNLDNGKCSNPATQASYRKGITYAVQTLKSACPKASIYLDAAHGGWLGWESASEVFLKEVKKLGIASLLRGFALNVAGYQEMGTLCPKVGTCMPNSETRGHKCCRKDACNLSQQHNPGFSLLNYAASLKQISKSVLPNADLHFVLDTGRNGVANSRKSSCGNWCNIRGAGFGVLPTTKTAAPSLIDAYMWLKRPGESDGCTKRLPNGGKCLRFDKLCGSADSVGSRKSEPRAPSGGGFFKYYLRLLARNS